MPIIETSIIIKEDREKIYELLKDIESFPKFIKNIKRIQVIKRLPHRAIINWEVMVDGAFVTWKEEDTYDDKNTSINFKMLEGDYDKYEGRWKIDNCPLGTRITISVSVEWGIPVLGKHVGRVLERKVRANLKSVLKAIANEIKEEEK